MRIFLAAILLAAGEATLRKAGEILVRTAEAQEDAGLCESSQPVAAHYGGCGLQSDSATL